MADIWFNHLDEDESDWGIYDSGGRVIGQMYPADGDPSKPRFRQNVAIATAAPEMRSLLIELLGETNPFMTNAEECECGENGTGFDDDGKPPLEEAVGISADLRCPECLLPQLQSYLERMMYSLCMLITALVALLWSREEIYRGNRNFARTLALTAFAIAAFVIYINTIGDATSAG